VRPRLSAIAAGRLASAVADLDALRRSWSSVRGGWRAAWRDSVQFLENRRVQVDTEAQTRDGACVVLRTRVRLNGDVQTDILRCWLDGTPNRSVEELAKQHFRAVADAAGGWPAVRATFRLATRLAVAVGAVAGIPSAVRTALEAGWESLPPSLIANWWVLFGIVSASVGLLLPWAVRLWLRWKFRTGLSIGRA